MQGHSSENAFEPYRPTQANLLWWWGPSEHWLLLVQMQRAGLVGSTHMLSRSVEMHTSLPRQVRIVGVQVQMEFAKGICFFNHGGGCCSFCVASMLHSSVQFSCSVMSDSLWPHELQHARPPCASATPRVHPNPFPFSQWCHPTISSSVVPFSSCPLSFSASESSPMSQLLPSGSQSIGVSVSASVLPVNIQCWFLPLYREGVDRGGDGWMASTQGTWVWANSGRWWRTGKPSVL